MKKYFLATLLLLLGLTASAQQKDLATLNDDFSNPESLGNWNWLHDIENWPAKLDKVEVKDGVLVLEPGTSGWFNDRNAPFLYKEVDGDFDIRARVKASGLQNNISGTPWSLGGLMIRVPKPNTKDDWKPKEENWMFMTTGIAEEPGKQVIETKYTINSRSNLKLRDAKADWVTLRVVRVGNAFIMLYKYDNDKAWTVHDRFYLVDWPQQLQVGFNCYTNSQAIRLGYAPQDSYTFNNTVYSEVGKPDLRFSIDYVRFQKPNISYSVPNDRGKNWLSQVYSNRLVDYSLSNQELAKMLGD